MCLTTINESMWCNLQIKETPEALRSQAAPKLSSPLLVLRRPLVTISLAVCRSRRCQRLPRWPSSTQPSKPLSVSPLTFGHNLACCLQIKEAQRAPTLAKENLAAWFMSAGFDKHFLDFRANNNLQIKATPEAPMLAKENTIAAFSELSGLYPVLCPLSQIKETPEAPTLAKENSTCQALTFGSSNLSS
jgi:hypothetical protein